MKGRVITIQFKVGSVNQDGGQEAKWYYHMPQQAQGLHVCLPRPDMQQIQTSDTKEPGQPLGQSLRGHEWYRKVKNEVIR